MRLVELLLVAVCCCMAGMVSCRVGLIARESLNQHEQLDPFHVSSTVRPAVEVMTARKTVVADLKDLRSNLNSVPIKAKAKPPPDQGDPVAAGLLKHFSFTKHDTKTASTTDARDDGDKGGATAQRAISRQETTAEHPEIPALPTSGAARQPNFRDRQLGDGHGSTIAEHTSPTEKSATSTATSNIADAVVDLPKTLRASTKTEIPTEPASSAAVYAGWEWLTKVGALDSATPSASPSDGDNDHDDWRSDEGDANTAAPSIVTFASSSFGPTSTPTGEATIDPTKGYTAQEGHEFVSSWKETYTPTASPTPMPAGMWSPPPSPYPTGWPTGSTTEEWRGSVWFSFSPTTAPSDSFTDEMRGVELSANPSSTDESEAPANAPSRPPTSLWPETDEPTRSPQLRNSTPTPAGTTTDSPTVVDDGYRMRDASSSGYTTSSSEPPSASSLQPSSLWPETKTPITTTNPMTTDVGFSTSPAVSPSDASSGRTPTAAPAQELSRTDAPGVDATAPPSSSVMPNTTAAPSRVPSATNSPTTARNNGDSVTGYYSLTPSSAPFQSRMTDAPDASPVTGEKTDNFVTTATPSSTFRTTGPGAEETTSSSTAPSASPGSGSSPDDDENVPGTASPVYPVDTATAAPEEVATVLTAFPSSAPTSAAASPSSSGSEAPISSSTSAPTSGTSSPSAAVSRGITSSPSASPTVLTRNVQGGYNTLLPTSSAFSITEDSMSPTSGPSPTITHSAAPTDLSDRFSLPLTAHPSSSPTVLPTGMSTMTPTTATGDSHGQSSTEGHPTSTPTATPSGHSAVSLSPTAAPTEPQTGIPVQIPTEVPTTLIDNADDEDGTGVDLDEDLDHDDSTPSPTVDVFFWDGQTPTPTGQLFSEAPTPGPTASASAIVGDSARDGSWLWWMQFGSHGDDGVQALAAGVGNHVDSLYIAATKTTGADTGVRTFEADARERWQRHLQTETRSSLDVVAASFSSEGIQNWENTTISDGEDFALCAAAQDKVIAIAGYTTGDLFSENVGGEDAFLLLRDPDTGDSIGGWQAGSEGSERIYALAVEDSSRDLIIGGYTTGSLFATNDESASQFMVARLNTTELMRARGSLDLRPVALFGSVTWGWQNASTLTGDEAIVALRADSVSGTVIVVGVRGLMAGSNPRDVSYFPSDDESINSFVATLDLTTGNVIWTSSDVEGLATAVTIDRSSGNVFLAGFSSLEGADTVFVQKIDGVTGMLGWNYTASSVGVSDGRALALDADESGNIVVAGTTPAGNSYATEDMDMFVLVLDTKDGSERCYYQDGTDGDDVVSGVLAAIAEEESDYPRVIVGGYTEGSLAGTHAGGTDIFLLGLNTTKICSSFDESSEPEDSENDTLTYRGTVAAGAVSVFAVVAIAGAAASGAVLSSGAIASVAPGATGGGGGAVGVGGWGDTSGVTTLVTVLSAGQGIAAAGGVGSLPPPGDASARSPSSSLGFVLMSQLQFLATLSLVSSVREASSMLAAFVENLRWVNLWIPVPMGEVLPESCNASKDDTDGSVGGSVFVGNTLLVVGMLLGILFFHVLVISAVEAYWLAEDRAIAAITSARQKHGITVTELERRSDTSSIKSLQRRSRRHFRTIDAYSGPELDQDTDAFSPGRGGGNTGGRHGELASRSPSPAPASSVGSSPPSPRHKSAPSPLSGLVSHRRAGCPASAFGRSFQGRSESPPPRRQFERAHVATTGTSTQHISGRLLLTTSSHVGSMRSITSGSSTLSPNDRTQSRMPSFQKNESAGRTSPLELQNCAIAPDASGRGLIDAHFRTSWPVARKDGFGVAGISASVMSEAFDDSSRGDGTIPRDRYERETLDDGSPRLYDRTGRDEHGEIIGPHEKPDRYQGTFRSAGDVADASVPADCSDQFGRFERTCEQGLTVLPTFCSGESESTHQQHRGSTHGDDYIHGHAIGSAIPEGVCAMAAPPSPQARPCSSGRNLGECFYMDGRYERPRIQQRPGCPPESFIDRYTDDYVKDGKGTIATRTFDGETDEHPIQHCRRRSRSFWLHFPHLELLFLFWAFEGAVAVQVSALRHAVCPWVFYFALVTMLLFPVLMILMVWRTIVVRVRPDELLVFRPRRENDGIIADHHLPSNPEAAAVSVADVEVTRDLDEERSLALETAGDGANGFEDRGGEEQYASRGVPESEVVARRQGLWAKFVYGWTSQGLLFSWADKGNWESAATHDQETRREADWFRIGFEPVFVDLSKSGSSYLVFLLLKWFALACVGVLVDDSVWQLSLFAALHAFDFFVLITRSPFANRAINCITALMAAVDCASAGLMTASTSFNESSEADNLNDAVFFLQLAALIVIVIPVYVDACVSVTILAVTKVGELLARSGNSQSPTEVETDRARERAYAKKCAGRSWPRLWCSMAFHNTWACIKDVREGVRPPRRLRDRQNHTRHGCRMRVSCVCCPRRRARLTAAPSGPSPAIVAEAACDARSTRWDWRSGNGSSDRSLRNRKAGWTLPPKLEVAGNGARAWDEISTGRARARPGQPGVSRAIGQSYFDTSGGMCEVVDSPSSPSAWSVDEAEQPQSRTIPTSLLSGVHATPIPSDVPRRKSSVWTMPGALDAEEGATVQEAAERETFRETTSSKYDHLSVGDRSKPTE